MNKYLNIQNLMTALLLALILGAVGYAFDFNNLKGEVKGIKAYMSDQDKYYKAIQEQQKDYYDKLSDRIGTIERILMEGR